MDSPSFHRDQTQNPSEKTDNMERFILKTRNGKMVQIRKSNDNELRLYAVDNQLSTVNDTFVEISQREMNQKKQMAFRFTYKGDIYSLMVEGGNLKLDRLPNSDNVESHWFEMEPQSGEHYGLKSVTEPETYVTIASHKRKHILGLCNNNQECLYVTNTKV